MSDETVANDKRTRTSPRVIFAQELLSMLDEYVATRCVLGAEGSHVARATVSDIRAKIKTMMAAGAPTAVYTGRHFVGRKHNGTHEAFQTTSAITRLKFEPQYEAVFGPMRTSTGAEFRAKHPEMLAEMVPYYK